jgi:hypothetical protein
MWLRPGSLILAAWLGVGLTFIGIGLLVCRAIRSPASGADRCVLAFWVGWVSTLFALQVWHLFLAVSGRALALAAVVGALGLAVDLRQWRRALGSTGRGVLALAALAAIALWLANRALDGIRQADAGAYFLPTIRWLVEYPIVPGLANLFVPFGFNQSYFLYVAMLEIGPFAHRGYHVANGLLLLALAARGLVGLHRLLASGRRCAPADVFHALFLPVALAVGESFFLTSPSPDVGVFVLGVVASGELVRLLSRPAPADSRPVAVAIALLAAGGVTVKLSFAGLAAALVAIAVLVSVVRDPGHAARTVVATGAAISAGMVPWVGRNVVLSGRPFYPSALGALPVEWRTRSDAVEWIVAPMHFGLSLWEALRAPRWFVMRLDSLDWFGEDVVVPAAIAAAALVSGLAAFCVRKLRGRPPSPWRVSPLIVVPAVVSLVFIAATAPMPRYAGATFWLIALDTVLLVVANGGGLDSGWRRRAAGAAVVIAACAVLARDRPLLRPRSDFATPCGAMLTETRLPSGLVVRVPDGGTCWNAPPPCTPQPNPALRLRRPGDLGAGFMLDPAT